MPERPDPGTWDEPQMRRLLAVRNITEVYRALIGLGFSQHRISRLTGQSQSEVSEILKGRRVVAYDVLRRIATGLGIPYGHMGLAYTDAEGNVVSYPGEGEDNSDPLEDDDVITRRVLGAVTVALFGEAALDGPIMQSGTKLLGEPGGIPLVSGPPSKLTKHDIAWIMNATNRFRELDHEYGGTMVHAAAQGMAEQVVGGLRTSPPLRELQLGAAELLRISAWTSYDAGHRKIFWKHIYTALDLTRQAGHPPTIAVIVDDAARAEQLAGRHRAAAKLFELVTIRRKPSAVDWSLLARSYVPTSPEAARHALERATDALGADSDGAQGAIGGAWLELGEYAAAAEAFNRSLPHRNGRAALTDTACLAIVHLQTGEIAVGLWYAETVLPLAETVRSTQGSDVLRRLSTVLAVQKDSTAQDLARRVAAAASHPA